jgi:dipeptidase
MNMNADQFTKPAKLEFKGNVTENYRRFRQQFEIYISAAGFDATNVPKYSRRRSYRSVQYIYIPRKDPEVILAKFQNYCEPKKNITYERHIFNTRVQQQTQSFDAYLTELRVQVKKCAYGTLQDEIIRDRLVVGMRDIKYGVGYSRARTDSTKLH